MNQYASFKVFSLMFGAVYMALFWLNEFYGIAYLRFYPVVASREGVWRAFFNERQPPETAGPAILWYFWLFGALAASTVVSLVVPRAWAARIPHSWMWMVSAALLLAILVYERRWFY